VIKRTLWDIVLVILAFMAPWWVVLVVGAGGAILFSWYIEFVIMGAILDALYGGTARHWYTHLIHTGLFTSILGIIEFIKSKISVD
jgi:hypothetical protein